MAGAGADNQNEFDCDAVRVTVAATNYHKAPPSDALPHFPVYYVHTSTALSHCPLAMPPTPASIISDALTSLSKATNLAVSLFPLALSCRQSQASLSSPPLRNKLAQTSCARRQKPLRREGNETMRSRHCASSEWRRRSGNGERRRGGPRCA